MFLHRHGRKRLEFEIDVRARILVRYARRIVDYVADGEHRQHLLPELLHQLAIAGAELAWPAGTECDRPPDALHRTAGSGARIRRCQCIKCEIRASEPVRPAESAGASTGLRLHIRSRACGEQYDSELVGEAVAGVCRSESEELERVLVALPGSGTDRRRHHPPRGLRQTATPRPRGALPGSHGRQRTGVIDRSSSARVSWDSPGDRRPAMRRPAIRGESITYLRDNG